MGPKHRFDLKWADVNCHAKKSTPRVDWQKFKLHRLFEVSMPANLGRGPDRITFSFLTLAGETILSLALQIAVEDEVCKRDAGEFRGLVESDKFVVSVATSNKHVMRNRVAETTARKTNQRKYGSSRYDAHVVVRYEACSYCCQNI